MVDFNQLKAKGNELLGKASDMAGQAKEKAGPLADQAKEKAAPLASKAKGAAAKGVDKAAGSLDSATGGKYKGKIDTVSDRLGQKLQTEPPLVTPTTATGVAAGTAAVHNVDNDSATTVQVGDVKPDPASPWPEPTDPDLPPATILG